MIRPVTIEDAADIARIYNYYIAHTIITFDLEPKTAEWFAALIEERTKQFPWLVYEFEGKVTAYAYASAWNSRAAYDKTIELSIYADNEFSGRGHAIRIYKQLIAELKEGDFHALMAGISLPNDASVRLHESFGFEKVAHYKEVGYKFDQWIDVGYWQLMNSK